MTAEPCFQIQGGKFSWRERKWSKEKKWILQNEDQNASVSVFSFGFSFFSRKFMSRSLPVFFWFGSLFFSKFRTVVHHGRRNFSVHFIRTHRINYAKNYWVNERVCYPRKRFLSRSHPMRVSCNILSIFCRGGETSKEMCGFCG